MLLRRADRPTFDTSTAKSLEKIQKDCSICSEFASRPRRFKLTIGSEELRFNHSVQVDTMFLSGRPVIHMVDEATHVCAASFLQNQSTTEIWKSIQQMWSLVYLGPPDFLIVDQGSAYTSAEMKGTVEAFGVRLEEAPIETPGAIGVVERYHGPLRLAYERICADTDRNTTDKECLQLAVFAVNCTVRPEGLCPALLVFGAIPRPARTIPAPSQLERARLIEKVMDDVAKEQSRRKIAFGLRSEKSPRGIEQSPELRRLPPGSPVLVYRTKSKQWEEPFKFVHIEGKTVVVQMNHGRRLFRSSCVKPYVIQPYNEHTALTSSSTDHSEPAADFVLLSRNNSGPENESSFAEAREEEFVA